MESPYFDMFRNLLVLDPRSFICDKCGYEWECRTPHNWENPPASCPRCQSKEISHVKADEKRVAAWRKHYPLDSDIRII